MRILFIASESHGGGSTVALYGIIKVLYEKGYGIYVFLPDNEGWLAVELDRMGIPYFLPRFRYNCSISIWPDTYNPFIFLFHLLKRLIKRLLVVKDVREVINRVNPDIVHTNVGPLDLGLGICRRKRIPHIWHMREYQDKDFGMKIIPNKRHYIRKLKSPFNYNIAITKDIFNYWELREGVDRVIYDGVFSIKDLSNLRHKKREKYILFVGRIEEAKDPLSVIKAYAFFRNKYNMPEYKLILVGHFDSNSYYKQSCDAFIIDNHLNENVMFLGHSNSVYDYMATASCMIVSSKSEGFGFITVEAMLNKCPVIGRDSGGTKEQFDNGLAFEGFQIALRYNTEEELADRIHIALTTDMSEMTNRAYDMVINNYSIEKSGSEVESFYRSIVSN